MLPSSVQRIYRPLTHAKRNIQRTTQKLSQLTPPNSFHYNDSPRAFDSPGSHAHTQTASDAAAAAAAVTAVTAAVQKIVAAVVAADIGSSAAVAGGSRDAAAAAVAAAAAAAAARIVGRCP